MISPPTFPNNRPGIRRMVRWSLFVGCWMGLGIIWLLVLPRHSASEQSQRRWQAWEAQGIDPSATYYSELECHTEILARWKEERAAAE